MVQPKGIQAILFFCIFYFVFTEVALSPFYPQFFEKVFDIKDLEYTGFYIFMARLTVVISAPIWGLLAKRYEVKYLLFTGQWISVFMLIGMGASANAEQFLIFTVLLLIGKSSFLLIYPLLIELGGHKQNAAVAGCYHVVLHSAVIMGTLLGACLLKLNEPLDLFYWMAVCDLGLWIICWFALRKVFSKKQKSIEKNSPRVGNHSIGFMLTIGLVIFTFHTANNVIRPYFITYTVNDFGLSLTESSWIFIAPSLMAILAYPFIRKACIPERLTSVYLFAVGMLSGSLFLQGATNSLMLLLLGRVFYGFFLAVSQAALEIYLFQRSRDSLHLNYTMAASFQNIGLLAAPLLASSLVTSYNPAFPLIIAAVICLVNLGLARLTIFRSESRSTTQETKVFDC
ncbi:MFS transporter [Paenibacillus alkaliterrae]